MITNRQLNQHRCAELKGGRQNKGPESLIHSQTQEIKANCLYFVFLEALCASLQDEVLYVWCAHVCLCIFKSASEWVHFCACKPLKGACGVCKKTSVWALFLDDTFLLLKTRLYDVNNNSDHFDGGAVLEARNKVLFHSSWAQTL